MWRKNKRKTPSCVSGKFLSSYIFYLHFYIVFLRASATLYYLLLTAREHETSIILYKEFFKGLVFVDLYGETIVKILINSFSRKSIRIG